MRASVVTVTDPFNPVHARQTVQIRRRRRLRALAPNTRLPHICLLNGTPVLRAGWNRRVRDGDVVAFVVLQQGGDGSNPLRMILMIAVSMIAPQIGMLAYESMVGAAGITSMGATIAGAVGSVMGMALVNTLVPPPKPPSALQNQSLAAPSPTYSLGAQGNNARVGQPIPVIYGRHMTYPDWGAQPYTEYAGNEQYLYQLLVIGQGYFDIEQIRLEDTVIVSDVIEDGAVHNADGAFEEVQYQVIQPGGTVTLFPTNVVSSSEVTGQELPGTQTGTYARSGTTVTVTKTAHGLAVGKSVYLDFTSGAATDGDFTITGVPTPDTFTVTHATSGTTSGNVVVHTYVGPYILNGAGTQTNALAFDLVAPRGLYYAQTDGSLAQKSISVAIIGRQVDDDGAPTGPWNSLAEATLTAATTTPQRVSHRTGVAAGRYEVKLRRTDAKDTDTRAGHDIVWAAGRAYLPGSQNYGQVTLLALRMRASNQLSGMASRKINTISTRKLQTWSAGTWSAETATRSIAWALADICKASYGLGLPDSRIDLAGLLALDTIWSARGDHFDGVFDSQGTAWEALQQVAKVGRAVPFQQGGVITVVRDGPQAMPSWMLTTRSIVKGSFKLDYLMPNEEQADAIDVTYFDSGVWQERTVRAALPGSSEQTVAKIKLFGCTDRAQAWREGMYQAACNRYRRRHVTVATEMDGFIASLGDMGAIQHDMPQWGQAGEAVAWDAATKTLTCSEPLDWSAGGNHYVALRRRDGAPDGPWQVTPGSQANQAVFLAAPGITPDLAGDRERTHYAFGPADALYIKVRPISIRARSLESAEITAVVESDYVHTADTGTPPDASAWQLATRITQPVIAGLMARSDPNAAEKMFLSWQPAGGADHYLVEVSDSGNGWTRVGEPRTSNYTAVAPYGPRTMLRVCAVGLTRGPWVEIWYGGASCYAWSGNDADPAWSIDTDPAWSC